MIRPRRLISFDWAMKRLLRSKAHFGILEGFLSELLREETRILEILEGESDQERQRDKQNRVDLRARNAGGEIILIEVQYERQFDYLQRILHSTAQSLVENLDQGRPYGEIVKVISVSIRYFDLGQGEDYVYHGATRFIGLHRHDELQLSEAQQDRYRHLEPQALFPEYYLIKVKQFDDIARDSLDEWIYFLKHEEVPDGLRARGLAEAKEQLDILKLPEAERRAYERYQDDLHQQASMVQSSYGWGKHQGLKQGREEGQQQERLRIARGLLDLIADERLLAERTGLTPGQVAALRSEPR